MQEGPSRRQEVPCDWLVVLEVLLVLLQEGPSLHVLLVLAGPESAVVQAQAGGDLVEALEEF